MPKITVKGETREYPEGVLYREIAEDFQPQYSSKIACVLKKGKIRELNKVAETDTEISFFTLQDSVGHKLYERTVLMMMMKAFQDACGEALDTVTVEFAIGPGLYCKLWGEAVVSQELLKDVEERMRKMSQACIPIAKNSYPVDKAREILLKQGATDKVKLLKFRRSSSINLYCLDGYYDYFYGYMLPDTGYVKGFALQAFDEGFMLVLPRKENPEVVPALLERNKLFRTLDDMGKWSNYFGINAVGDLNEAICQGRIHDLILVQEAEQERKIGEIAKEIAARQGVKFIMIAGPSSSGKTTFSHRLSIQLMTQGMKPHPIALDDYFVNREDTPRDEDGNYDFECLGAMDIDLFNRDMNALLAGETVEMPSFNFKIGRREYNGKKLTLGPDDVLVIEGIHGLDNRMTYALPDESKYRIYISALTSLNVDCHNRIQTTDARLLRRMVRDFRTRGASAQKTISMWPSVRRGEENNIFPFQEGADVMFNSATIYELAVLKQYVEPLLYNVEPWEPEYVEAKRLLKFLSYFLGVSSENVPNNSICREFIGGSYFDV